MYCQVDLAQQWSDVVHVSDSSTRGFALMYRRAPHGIIQEEARFRERWRFLEVEPVPPRALFSGAALEVVNSMSPLGGDPQPLG